MIRKNGTQISHFSPRRASTSVSATANSPMSIGITAKELKRMARRTISRTFSLSS